MQGLGWRAEQVGGKRGAGVERGVDERFRHTCGTVGASGADDAPAARAKEDRRRRFEWLDGAAGIDADRHATFGALARDGVVEDRGLGADRSAGPIPAMKAGVERFVAVVGVDIALAAPARVRVIEANLDAATGRDGTPAVAAGGVDLFGVAG